MPTQYYLYDIFRHWECTDGRHKNSVWFISDPHFNDAEAKEFRRNYIGDDELVKSINRKVNKNDTLVILGDIGNIEFIKKLRGYKVLIKGNHDSGVSNYRRFQHCLVDYYEIIDTHLFDEVYEGTLQISPKIILSHEPVEYKYCFNIHGHDHSNAYKKEHHLNVCCELINYTPVSLKDIVTSGKLKHIPDIHREAIEKRI